MSYQDDTTSSRVAALAELLFEKYATRRTNILPAARVRILLNTPTRRPDRDVSHDAKSDPALKAKREYRAPRSTKEQTLAFAMECLRLANTGMTQCEIAKATGKRQCDVSKALIWRGFDRALATRKKVEEMLALGRPAHEIADLAGVSASRVRQIRRKLPSMNAQSQPPLVQTCENAPDGNAVGVAAGRISTHVTRPEPSHPRGGGQMAGQLSSTATAAK